MYEKILTFLKEKPQPYQPGTKPFWDDTYIAKEILKAHLDPDHEGGTRKHAFMKESAKWIAKTCNGAKGKKLLDLGCGAGVYAEMFEEEGFQVTGLDFSKVSIEYAKESAKKKGKEITYHYADYLSMEFEQEFDVITLIYCDYGALSPMNRGVLLSKVKKALKPNGIFILDGFTKAQVKNVPKTPAVSYLEKGMWCEKPHVCIELAHILPETQNFMAQIVVIEEETCESIHIWNQFFDADMLERELGEAGFKDMQYFDDVCGKEKTENYETICVKASV